MWKWNTDYIIEDNFLESKHFELLKSVQFDESQQYEIFAHAVEKNGEIIFSKNKIPDDVLVEIHNTYSPKLLEYLKKLRPELVDSYTFSDIVVIGIRGRKKFPG